MCIIVNGMVHEISKISLETEGHFNTGVLATLTAVLKKLILDKSLHDVALHAAGVQPFLLLSIREGMDASSNQVIADRKPMEKESLTVLPPGTGGRIQTAKFGFQSLCRSITQDSERSIFFKFNIRRPSILIGCIHVGQENTLARTISDIPVESQEDIGVVQVVLGKFWDNQCSGIKTHIQGTCNSLCFQGKLEFFRPSNPLVTMFQLGEAIHISFHRSGTGA